MFAYLEERDGASTGATDTAKDLENEVQAKKADITEKIQAALKESSELVPQDKNSWQSTTTLYKPKDKEVEADQRGCSSDRS